MRSLVSRAVKSLTRAVAGRVVNTLPQPLATAAKQAHSQYKAGSAWHTLAYGAGVTLNAPESVLSLLNVVGQRRQPVALLPSR